MNQGHKRQSQTRAQADGAGRQRVSAGALRRRRKPPPRLKGGEQIKPQVT